MKLRVLIESMAPSLLYHYTNVFNLYNILKTGYLKTKNYPGDDKGTTTLPVVRSSMTDKKNLESLSDEIGNVRFIIKREELTNGKIRNLKHSKINEFNKDYLDSLIKYYGSKKEAYRNIKLYKKDKVKFFKNINANDILKVSTYMRRYDSTSKEREGEERFSIKKGGNIPIKNMKIELLKGFVNNVEKLDYIDWQAKKELIDKIIDNKTLFIKNNEYNLLVNYIRKNYERSKK